jgi:anthranilate synthase component I
MRWGGVSDVLASALHRAAGQAVTRRLTDAPDPFSLYAALCPDARGDTGLFEAMGGTALLMERAAARATCRGDTVRLEALSENGRSLLAAVARALPAHLRTSSGQEMEFSFARSDSPDLETRLLAPSPLDALRTLLSTSKGDSDEPSEALALGIVAFDYAALGEDVAQNAEDALGFPDFLFWIPESLLVHRLRGRRPRPKRPQPS